MNFKTAVGQSVLRTLAILAWVFVAIGLVSGFDYGADSGNIAVFVISIIVAITATIGALAIAKSS